MKNKLILMVIIIALLASSQARPAQAQSPTGQIAFRSDNEIYIINADGSGRTNLTNNSASDWWPTWSGNGHQLAFVSDRDGNWEIYKMNADGSGQTRLTNNSNADNSPNWSLDGQKIVFVSNRDENDEIYSMNADGSQQTRLTNNTVSDTEATWSPQSSFPVSIPALTWILGGIPCLLFILLSLTWFSYKYWSRATADLTTDNELPRAAKIRRASEYRNSIIKSLQQKQTVTLTDQSFLITKLDQLEARLRELNQRLESFEKDPIIQHDLKNLPVTIAHLATQLEGEPDPQFKRELQNTLARCYEQQRLLDSLVALMRRTDLKIDETLASMGTLYTQVQLLKAKDIDNQRLTSEVDEQINILNDLLTTINEMYDSVGH